MAHANTCGQWTVGKELLRVWDLHLTGDPGRLPLLPSPDW